MAPPACGENTASGEEAASGLVLQENVRNTPLLPLASRFVHKVYLQENEAFTRQMAAKSRKIVMDAEHGDLRCSLLSMFLLHGNH